MTVDLSSLEKPAKLFDDYDKGLDEDDLDELTLSDVQVYEEEGPGPTFPVLKHITQRHHRMAQLVALGWKQNRIAKALECSTVTVNRLVHNEAFKLLVGAELDKLRNRDHAIQVKMSEVAEVGLDKIHAMLVSGDVTPKYVKETTTDMLDRTGHGPSKQVSQTVTLGVQPDTLERIKADAQPARRYVPSVSEGGGLYPEAEEADLVPEMGGADGQSLGQTEDPEDFESGQREGLSQQVLQIIAEGGAA